VDVVGELRMLTMNEVEEHFPVSLRARQPRVYGADGLALPAERRFGDLPHDASSHLGVADDTSFRHLDPPRLELRLDEHDGLPPPLRQRERRRQRETDTDE